MVVGTSSTSPKVLEGSQGVRSCSVVPDTSRICDPDAAGVHGQQSVKHGQGLGGSWPWCAFPHHEQVRNSARPSRLAALSTPHLHPLCSPPQAAL